MKILFIRAFLRYRNIVIPRKRFEMGGSGFIVLD